MNVRAIQCLLMLALVGLCAPASAGGQSRFTGGFERDVNRYRWTSDFQLAVPVSGWNLDLQNNFRSDAFILFDDRLSFRDENHTVLRGKKTFGTKEVTVHSASNWFSLSRVFQQDVMGGFRFPFSEKTWLEPRIGASLDQRPGFSEGEGKAPLRTDAGPAFGIRFGMPTTSIDEYQISYGGEGLIQTMAPRRGELFRAHALAERTFDGTRIRTRIELARVRRDAYQAASFLNRDDQGARVAETVESTHSDTLAASLIIDRPIANSTVVSGRLDFTTNTRSVETLRAPSEAIFFDSNFQRRVLEGELSTVYSQNQSLLRFSVRGGAEVENRRLTNEDDLSASQATQKQNLLRQADYDRGFLQVHLNTRVPLGSRTVLLSDVSANILRHDTPGVNPDDRDELYYNGVLGANVRLTRFVEIQLQVFGTYFHTVYIKSERSAENNVQRSLRFKPTVVWRPSSDTRLSVTSEVRANYTVDDFLLPGRRPTDQSARELSYTVDAEHDFGHDVQLRITGRWSDLRLGRFLDESFAEIPFDTLRTASTWIRLHVGQKIQAEIGVRVFIRSDYDRATTVRYDRGDGTGQPASIARPGRRTIAQFGPTTSVVWPLKNGAYLRLDGWATVQRVYHKLYGDLPEGFEQIIADAAKKGSRTLIPNLAVTMHMPF